MRRLAKVAAFAASTAFAAEAVGDVWGYTTFSCTDEIVYRYDTVAEACADHGIKAYMDSNEGIFPQCRVCDDDDDDGGAGIGGGGGAGIGNYKCGDDEIGGGETPCEPCGEGKVPNDDRTACLSCEWGELPGEPGRCSCDYAAVDLVAKTSLLAVPQNPWEHVDQYQCRVGHVIVGTSTLSSANEDDVCVWEFPEDYLEPTAVAFGHSHPHFHWQNDEGTLCDGTRLSAGEILNMTSTNYKFSDYDRRLAERWNLPLYLVSTSWGRVSVYRKDGSGQWAEEEI